MPNISKKARTFSGLDIPEIIRPNEKREPNKKANIFFFDSAGDKAPKQVMKFVKMVIEQGKKLSSPINFKFDQNYPVEHQYKNTECGVYSLYFIVHMLEDKITGHYLKTHVLKDEYMQQFRKIYYNEEL